MSSNRASLVASLLIGAALLVLAVTTASGILALLAANQCTWEAGVDQPADHRRRPSPISWRLGLHAKVSEASRRLSEAMRP